LHARTCAQVLVSIQGLVLVPLPYFNEAGYEKQARPARVHHAACPASPMTCMQSDHIAW
jgi:hypothetical protein